MHILLNSDDQLSAQSDEAIGHFRAGKLAESIRLFDAILEDWPLEPTVTMYRAAAQELVDWGIAESYVETHWSQIEALMYGGEPLLSLTARRRAVEISETPTMARETDAIAVTEEWPAGLSRRPTPTRREQPSWGGFGWDTEAIEHAPSLALPHHTPGPWPRELRIAQDLFQQGRRKAARMWARSYFESRTPSANTEAFFQQLPAPLQQALLRHPTPATQRSLDLHHIHTHDSHAAVDAYEAPTTVTPEVKAPTQRSRLWWALGITLLLAQSAMIIVLWLQR